LGTRPKVFCAEFINLDAKQITLPCDKFVSLMSEQIDSFWLEQLREQETTTILPSELKSHLEKFEGFIVGSSASVVALRKFGKNSSTLFGTGSLFEVYGHLFYCTRLIEEPELYVFGQPKENGKFAFDLQIKCSALTARETEITFSLQWALQGPFKARRFVLKETL